MKLKMPPVWCGVKIQSEEIQDIPTCKKTDKCLVLRTAGGALISNDRLIVLSVGHTAWVVRGNQLHRKGEECLKDTHKEQKEHNPNKACISIGDGLQYGRKKREAFDNADEWLAALMELNNTHA
jgi:hypothetical protein